MSPNDKTNAVKMAWPNEKSAAAVGRAEPTAGLNDLNRMLGSDAVRSVIGALEEIQRSGANYEYGLGLAQAVLANALPNSENVAELVDRYLPISLAAVLLRNPTQEIWEWIWTLRYHSATIEAGLYDIIPDLAKDAPAFSAAVVEIAGDVLRKEEVIPGRPTRKGESSAAERRAEWTVSKNLTTLWEGAPGWQHHWSRMDNGILAIIEQIDIRAYVRLLEAFEEPYSVAAAIFFSGAEKRFSRWRDLVLESPVAFNESGEWNGSLVLPLLLHVATQQLRTTIPQKSDDVPLEAVKGQVEQLVDAISETVLARQDGLPLSGRWAAHMMRVALRSAGGLEPPRPTDAFSPGYAETVAVESIVKARGINNWPAQSSPSLESWEPWCYLCVLITASYLGSNKSIDPASYLRSWSVGYDGASEEKLHELQELISPFRVFKQQVDSYGAIFLAWPVARSEAPENVWREAWGSASFLRELVEFGEFDKSQSDQFQSISDVVAAVQLLFSIGLMTLDALASPDTPVSSNRRESAVLLLGSLTNAALEMQAIQAIDLGFWSAAMRHLAVRRAIWEKVEGREAKEGELEFDMQDRPDVRDFLGGLSGDTEELFALLEVLVRNGAHPGKVREAVQSAQIDLGFELVRAEKLRALDGKRSKFSDTQFSSVQKIISFQA